MAIYYSSSLLALLRILKAAAVLEVKSNFEALQLVGKIS